MPKRARLRVRFSNTNDSQIKKAVSKIQKLYKVQEITTNRTDTLSATKEWDRENAINITDIRNVDFQNKLVDDFYSYDLGKDIPDNHKALIIG